MWHILYDYEAYDFIILAICSSGCYGRGTCVAPEQCSCDNSYTGNACQTRKRDKLIYLCS